MDGCDTFERRLAPAPSRWVQRLETVDRACQCVRLAGILVRLSEIPAQDLQVGVSHEHLKREYIHPGPQAVQRERSPKGVDLRRPDSGHAGRPSEDPPQTPVLQALPTVGNPESHAIITALSQIGSHGLPAPVAQVHCPGLSALALSNQDIAGHRLQVSKIHRTEFARPCPGIQQGTEYWLLFLTDQRIVTSPDEL